jgi:hypothetical protein
MSESKKELEGNMKRPEAMQHIAKAGTSISYRYEHLQEVNEALGIAIEDISGMDRLIKIIESDLKGEEWENAILQVIQEARAYIK